MQSFCLGVTRESFWTIYYPGGRQIPPFGESNAILLFVYGPKRLLSQSDCPGGRQLVPFGESTANPLFVRKPLFVCVPKGLLSHSDCPRETVFFVRRKSRGNPPFPGCRNPIFFRCAATENGDSSKSVCFAVSGGATGRPCAKPRSTTIIYSFLYTFYFSLFTDNLGGFQQVSGLFLAKRVGCCKSFVMVCVVFWLPGIASAWVRQADVSSRS